MKLQPTLHDGAFAFVCVAADTDLAGVDVVATMREAEGLTVVLPEAQARERGLAVRFVAAWITCRTPTELAAVGVTAAFAGALAQREIACNVIAGAHHDHLFVPADRAQAALAIIAGLTLD